MTRELAAVDEKFLLQCFPKRDPVTVSRAKGSKVFDTAGKEYTDLFSGIAVANVGHCHPSVVAAIKKQAEQFMHVSNYYHNGEMPRLARMLAAVAPSGIARTFFVNSGSEAIDGAVKVAKKYARKKGRSGMVLVSLHASFHGRLALTLTLTGQRKIKQDLGHYACYPGVVHAPAPYHYRYGGEMSPDEFGRSCAEEMRDMLDLYVAGEVAAVVVEPILGEGGIIVPPDTYLPSVRRICREREIPLIIDEVQTGMGRCGKMFACQLWNVEPDLMTIAKALGGGLPIGAFMVTEELASAMQEGDHFSTFGGNPVSCAAAMAVINILKEEKLVSRAATLGRYALSRLAEVAEGSSLVGDVRGKGMMMGVELVKSRRTKVPAASEAARVKEEMLRRGFLIGQGGIFKNVLRLQPPLVISKGELDEAMDALAGSLRSVIP